GLGRHHALDHGMAAPLEVDHERVADLGTHVGVAVGEIGERGPDVEPGEEPGGVLDPADGQRHAAPQRFDQLPLPRRNPLLRPQHLRLVLLQLRRHVALSAGESLAPLVIRRDSRLVGVRDLDVIAEYLVEPDLERRDTGALALPRLHGAARRRPPLAWRGPARPGPPGARGRAPRPTPPAGGPAPGYRRRVPPRRRAAR